MRAGFWLLLMMMLVGCGKAVDKVTLAEDSPYFGTWVYQKSGAQSEGMLLRFRADSTVTYRRCHAAGNGSHSHTTVDTSYIAALGPRQMTLRVGFSRLGFNMDFAIQEPPHREAGRWEMTVDGITLQRLPAARAEDRSAWPCPKNSDRPEAPRPADQGVTI